MSEPKSKFARRYDREFKENAVALVNQGRSQGEASRDLGRADESKKPVISTEAEAGQWAERSGETSNSSSRGRRRWANCVCVLRSAFARKAK